MSVSHETLQASRLLYSGHVVAIPTETVYGLAGDATNPEAVQRIFTIKKRPNRNPLIVHVADLLAAEKIAVFTPEARKLARTFWPGPLTLVLEKKPGSGIVSAVTCGLETIAIRVPAHPVTRDLLRYIKRPLAAPSANMSGCISPTHSQHVQRALGDQIPLIIDGGPSAAGVESTIVRVDTTQCQILRPGLITPNDLSRILGRPAWYTEITETGHACAPGMMHKHYAPQKPMRLNARTVTNKEGLLAFGPDSVTGARYTLWLSQVGDLREAAENLFDRMHQMDRMNVDTIAVSPIPNSGIGLALNDRLKRAATL